MLLREEMSLPSGVAGPFDLAPLAREAAICLGVLIRDFSMHAETKGNGDGLLDVADNRVDGRRESGVTGNAAEVEFEKKCRNCQVQVNLIHTHL